MGVVGMASPLDAELPPFRSAGKAMVWSCFTDAMGELQASAVLRETEDVTAGEDLGALYQFHFRCAEVVVWLWRAGQRGPAAEMVAKIWWHVRGAQEEAGRALWALDELLDQLSVGFPGLEDDWSDDDRAELVELVRELVFE